MSVKVELLATNVSQRPTELTGNLNGFLLVLQVFSSYTPGLKFLHRDTASLEGQTCPIIFLVNYLLPTIPAPCSLGHFLYLQAVVGKLNTSSH